MKEWSEDSAFWAAMEPALCAPARLALAESDVAAIIARLHPAPQARILDLGCGPGAHAIAFARRGYRVTGVDRSSRLLGRAGAAALDAGVRIEWVEADMRTFERPTGFDLVCSLYTSFGYFDDAQNRKVLENVRAALAAGGFFLLDVTGREVAARHFQERRSQEIDGVRYLEQAACADDGAAMISKWTIVDKAARADFTVRQRLYSGPELKDLLASVGFSDVTLAGTLDGMAPYDESARRLVACARAR